MAVGSVGGGVENGRSSHASDGAKLERAKQQLRRAWRNSSCSDSEWETRFARPTLKVSQNRV